MKIGRYEAWPTAKAVFKDVRGDDVTGLAAEVAYHVLFSIVPLLIFLTALVGVVSRAIGVDSVMDDITGWLFNGSGMPDATATVLQEPIERVVESESGGILTLGAVFALWGGKNAVSALMKALNVAFDVPEGRNFFVKTAVAVGLTIALGFGVMGASVVLLLGGGAGSALAGLLGLGDAWQTVWGILRWVLVPVLLVVALAVLYWAGPNVKAPFRWLTAGAVFTVVGWALATLLLGYYFQYAASYVSAYGVLGGLMAFVFWLYVMAAILLVGGSLNSVLLKLAGEQAVPRALPKPDAPESADAARAAAIGATGGPGSAVGGTTPAPVSSPAAGPEQPRFARGVKALGFGAVAGLAAAAIERVRR